MNQGFQDRVQEWLVACFGKVIASDLRERKHRFLEEALELGQAMGIPWEEVLQLVDYVYSRPPGISLQEVGGVMLTLAALCSPHGINIEEAGETELKRAWENIDKIRAKQAAKPKGSVLPQKVYRGWIKPTSSDSLQRFENQLKAMGVKVGEWSGRDLQWDHCEVPEDALLKLDPFWNDRFIWGLS